MHGSWRIGIAVTVAIICTRPSGAAAEAAQNNEDIVLRGIYDALSTYALIYDRCASMRFSYSPATSDQSNHLVISYISKKGPVTFTIFGDLPNQHFLNWHQWHENGTLRNEYEYRGFLNVEENSNAPLQEKPPSDESNAQMIVTLGIYPEIKSILYFHFWVSEYRAFNYETVSSQLMGSVSNCK